MLSLGEGLCEDDELYVHSWWAFVQFRQGCRPLHRRFFFRHLRHALEALSGGMFSLLMVSKVDFKV